MCFPGCIIFGVLNLSKEEIAGKRILEVGSRYVNGSLRPIIERLTPKEYVGVDIAPGTGVDRICNINNLINYFGENSFDVVICTEVLEHVELWQEAITNLKLVCKPNGIILVTAPSVGFYYHGYPHDYWRFEAKDLYYIFSDCEICKIEKDNLENEVLAKVIKPQNFKMNTLNDYKLYRVHLDLKAVLKIIYAFISKLIIKK